MMNKEKGMMNVEWFFPVILHLKIE